MYCYIYTRIQIKILNWFIPWCRELHREQRWWSSDEIPSQAMYIHHQQCFVSQWSHAHRGPRVPSIILYSKSILRKYVYETSVLTRKFEFTFHTDCPSWLGSKFVSYAGSVGSLWTRWARPQSSWRVQRGFLSNLKWLHWSPFLVRKLKRKRKNSPWLGSLFFPTSWIRVRCSGLRWLRCVILFCAVSFSSPVTPNSL